MSVGVLLVRVRVGGVDGRPRGDVLAQAAPSAHSTHDADIVARPAPMVVGPVQLVGRTSVGTGAAVT